MSAKRRVSGLDRTVASRVEEDVETPLGPSAMPKRPHDRVKPNGLVEASPRRSDAGLLPSDEAQAALAEGRQHPPPVARIVGVAMSDGPIIKPAP